LLLSQRRISGINRSINMEYLEIGPTPSEENCEQCGTAEYNAMRARAECVIYADQIQRHYGAPPEGTQIKVKSNRHEAGTYYEVAIYYSTPEGGDYAYSVESDDRKMLVHWDSDALHALQTINVVSD
jgi:hypothetical protein